MEKVKQLKALFKEKRDKNELLKAELVVLQRQYEKDLLETKNLEKEIEKLETFDVKVSDHALIRYCERVLNIDFEQIKKEILSPNLVNQVEILGNGTYPVEGFMAVVRNRVVATIILEK